MLRVGLVPCDLRHAYAILFAGAYSDGGPLFYVENGVGCHACLDKPAEYQILVFLCRRKPLDIVLLIGHCPRSLVRDLAVAVCGQEVFGPARVCAERRLHHYAAIYQALEIDHVLGHKIGEARHVADPEHTQVLLCREHIHHACREIGGDNHFGIVFAYELRRLNVALAVECDRSAECGKPVGLVRAVVRLGERGSDGDATGIVVLYDHGARLVHQIAEDVERIVRIGYVGLSGMLAALQKLWHGRKVSSWLDHLNVAKRKVPVHQPVQGRALPRILAVSQPLLLAGNVPGDLLVVECFALGAINERNLHLWREIIRLDCLVRLFEIFHLQFLPFASPTDTSANKTLSIIA